MGLISQKQLAEYFGASKTTLWRRLKELNFQKKSPGRFFDEDEQKIISKLLNFTIPTINKRHNEKH